jgi:hypothetical protein
MGLAFNPPVARYQDINSFRGSLGKIGAKSA